MIVPLSLPRRTYHGIQVLRGAAAIAVVTNHALMTHAALAARGDRWDFGNLVGIGAAGVDVFFVISGFIIFGMLRVRSAGRFSFSAFLLNRFTRIFPLYWIYTIFYAAFLALAKWSAGGLQAVRTFGGFSGGYLVSSLLLIPAWSPVDRGAVRPLLAQGWTLSYELCFYVLIGLAMRAARGGRPVVLYTGLLLGSTWCIAGSVSSGSAIKAFFGNAIMFEFLLGMAAHEASRQSGPWPRTALACGVLLIVASGFFRFDLQWRALVWGLPAFLIVYGLASLETIGRWPGFAILVGDCSYSLYLLHPIFIGLLHGVLKRHAGAPAPVQISLVAASVAGSVLLSIPAFVYLERPMLRGIGALLPARFRHVRAARI